MKSFRIAYCAGLALVTAIAAGVVYANPMCAYVYKDGRSCGNHAMAGSAYCFNHQR